MPREDGARLAWAFGEKLVVVEPDVVAKKLSCDSDRLEGARLGSRNSILVAATPIAAIVDSFLLDALAVHVRPPLVRAHLMARCPATPASLDGTLRALQGEAPVAVTKGITFTHAQAFLESSMGKGAWHRVIEASAAEDRATLGSVVAVGWYDLDLYARTLRTLDTVFGRGDLELLGAIGRYGAEKDINTVYRLFFRFANPIYAIEKVTEYWRKFHDTGTWSIVRTGDGRAEGTLRDWGHVDRALCRELVAYMTRVLELVGASEVHLSHPRCRADGEPACFFTLRWRAKGAM